MIERARALVQQSRAIVAITGAGISAESGVPTFRGEGGLFRGRDGRELATPEAFAEDPGLVWSFYRWRRRVVARCEPNAAHLALAEAEDAGRCEVTVITQNVDGLHHRAGSRWIVALHGDLFVIRCSGCGRERHDPDPDWPPLEGRASADPDDPEGSVILPRCERCDALERPGVVWFGESLGNRVLEDAWAATKRANVVLVVGTSAVVQPAASIYRVARARGTTVIEVNPESTPISEDVDISLRGTAGAILPDLLGARRSEGG